MRTYVIRKGIAVMGGTNFIHIEQNDKEYSNKAKTP